MLRGPSLSYVDGRSWLSASEGGSVGGWVLVCLFVALVLFRPCFRVLDSFTTGVVNRIDGHQLYTPKASLVGLPNPSGIIEQGVPEGSSTPAPRDVHERGEIQFCWDSTPNTGAIK